MYSLRNLVEHSYSQANLEVVARDMFTEMGVSDGLAGDMFTKRDVSGDVYTCPLVMSDSCNIDPIGNVNLDLSFVGLKSKHQQYYQIHRSSRYDVRHCYSSLDRVSWYSPGSISHRLP